MAMLEETVVRLSRLKVFFLELDYFLKRIVSFLFFLCLFGLDD